MPTHFFIVTCIPTAVVAITFAAMSGIAQSAPSSANRATCEPLGQPDCKSLVRYGNPNAHNRNFNRLLAENKAAGMIMVCRRLIDLPAGTANGNHSFGGDCTLQEKRKRTQVLICHDTMVGHFAIKKVVVSRRPSERTLVDFAREQCFGG